MEDDRRGYPRIRMYAGVFITRGETAYLTEVSDVSAGGAKVARPANWVDDSEGRYHLYFVLDQERILCLQGKVVHQQGETVGFEFLPGYAIQSEQLLAESRNWR